MFYSVTKTNQSATTDLWSRILLKHKQTQSVYLLVHMRSLSVELKHFTPPSIRHHTSLPHPPSAQSAQHQLLAQINTRTLTSTRHKTPLNQTSSEQVPSAAAGGRKQFIQNSSEQLGKFNT